MTQDLFADPHWVSRLDVVFANRYFAAVDASSAARAAQPTAWRPLLAARSAAGVEPIQFALAGMNIHINHDLPLAVVATCEEGVGSGVWAACHGWRRAIAPCR